MKEREHPRAPLDIEQRGIDHNPNSQRREPYPRDEPQEHAQRDAQGRHLQLFSSVSLTLARSSDGSFSIARSSI